MTVFSVDTYTTTIIRLEHNEESYEITHREDADGYFVPEWQVVDEDGEEVWNTEIRPILIEHSKKYLDK